MSLFGAPLNTNIGLGSSFNSFGNASSTLTADLNANTANRQTPNWSNLTPQQRQELERIERRKNALQTALSKTPFLNAHLLAFTYQFDSNAALKQQEVDNMFQNVPEEFVKKLLYAKEQNPDPQSCFALPLKGISDLVQREQQQRQQIETVRQQLNAVQSENQLMQDTLNTVTLKKVEECKRRHKKLLNQFLRISAMLEDYAQKENLAQVNYPLENHLDQSLFKLQESSIQVGKWQNTINEINSDMMAIMEQSGEYKNELKASPGQDSELNELLTSVDTDSIFTCLDQQQELLESLSETIKQDNNITTEIENALRDYSNGYNRK